MKVTPLIAHEMRELRSYHKWSFARIAKKVKVSEGAVRFTLKDVKRALGPRTRNKTTTKILARRERISEIAKVPRMVMIKGRKVKVGKMFPALGDIAVEYARKFGEAVALATVHRDLAAEGFTSERRPRVVNNDPVKNKERLVFAKECKKEGIDGKQTLFCDECWVNDNDNSNRYEWCAPGEQPTARKFQKRPGVKLMVWGLIGFNYKSELVFFEENVTADVYQKDTLPHIQSAVRRFPKRWFMHDGAKAHTAKSTRAALNAANIKVLKWPAHSPHLNPIEKLWNHFHIEISKKRPKDLDDLKAKAKAVWASFDQAMINRYVLGFDEGIARTITEKGLPW